MTAKRFRTKPVEVLAVQFDGENYDEIGLWTQGLFSRRTPRNDFGEDDGFTAEVYDELHETWINVSPGQWIICGTKGEFYPCDPETFDWQYEEVDGRIERPADDPERFTVTVKANRPGLKRGPLPEGETARILSLEEQEAVFPLNEVRRKNGMEEL